MAAHLPKKLLRRPVTMLREFMDLEASGGIVLMVAALLALVVANSPLSGAYFALLHHHLGPLSIQHWINDGLMTFFFLLVGLEIKHEMLRGELATFQQRVLPGAGALGGMAAPALVYLFFNHASPTLARGWAIPTATDIAFALGVLSLLGSRVPASLKVFLTALAIIDDLGAVLIIALFYGANLEPLFLCLASLVFAILLGLNRKGVQHLGVYGFLGFILWALILKSGLHATLAGVLLALAVPMGEEKESSPLHLLEDRIDSQVPYFVLPLFSFANAGVSLSGFHPSILFDSLTLGVGLGLLLGKVAGILLVSAILIKLGWARLPVGASWAQFLGLGFLCGIGFTMSLFISLLAFAGDSRLQDEAKVGILLGSLLSGLVGAAVLKLSSPKIRTGELAELEEEAQGSSS